jgi:hypothetical protein
VGGRPANASGGTFAGSGQGADRDGKTERALEELNEGTELMMALLDFVPGEQALDVQLGYIYGAVAEEFHATGKQEMAERYRDLQLGIFRRVKDDLTADEYLTGTAASAIKGIGEVYYSRGDPDQAIEYLSLGPENRAGLPIRLARPVRCL